MTFNLLKLIFLISLCFTLFWVSSLSFEALADIYSALWPSILTLTLTLVLTPIILRTRSLIIPAESPLNRIIISFLVCCSLGYTLLIPLYGLLGWLHTLGWENPNHPESQLYILLIAIWLPLWSFPMFGTYFCCWYLRRKGK